MNHISKYLTAAGVAFATMLASCDKDGTLLYTDGGDRINVEGTSSDIVLDFSTLNALVLSIYFDENGTISLSDPRVEAPQYAITNTIQMSGDPKFENVVETTMPKGVYERQYTCAELNNLLGRLGFEGGVKAPLFIRICSRLGANVDAKFSNMLVVNVTPYVIDMTMGQFLNTALEETGRTLYSANSDRIYKGFIGAGGWENWYLAEGNGVMLGNENQDWYAFKLGSTETNNCGNMWYPGIAGCYYTVVDAQAMEWSALLVPELNVSGDVSGAMEYDRKANHWTMPIKATAGGVLNVSISGNGKQYNVATGTTDSEAIDTPVSFGGNADNLTFATSGAPASISVPMTESGDATLLLELSNPQCWTLTIVNGGVEGPEVIDPYLWVTGIDDGITGSWGYNNYLINYNEDSPLYGGVINVNSLWGYVYMKQATWGDGYGFDSGDAFEGKLNVQTSSNIPAPDPGLYLFDVSLASMSYKLTAVNNVSYTGLNDDWSFHAMTQVSGTIFEAEIEKTADTPWGVKIVINQDWGLYFGGCSTPGKMVLYADGFTGDNELSMGKHVLRVDLGKGTYEYK